MEEVMDIKSLEKTAAEIRCGIIKAIHNAGSGHPGGSLSAADIVTALYFDEMNVDPKDPKMKGRDKFILSKGHAGPVQYSALAVKGYYPMEDFMTLRKLALWISLCWIHMEALKRVFRDIRICIKCRGSKCLQALWGRGSLRQVEWRWPTSWTMIRAEFMCCWEMERSRKASCGKH